MGSDSSPKPKYGICPVCLRKTPVDAGSGKHARCQCGASVFLTKDGRLAASIKEDAPDFQSVIESVAEPTEIATDVREKTEEITVKQDDNTVEPEVVAVEPDANAAKTEQRSGSSKRREHRQQTPIIWAGAATILLLLFALLFMLTRRPPSEVDRANQNSIAPPIVSEPPAKLARGTFRRLLAGAPAPTIMSQGEPNSENATASETNSAKESKKGIRRPGYREIPPPSPVSLPERKPARERLKVPVTTVRGSIFRDAFDQAYEQYETLMTIDEADGIYAEELGKTLAVTRQAFLAELQQEDSSRLEELRYLLAYLSFKAGHLPETMVYGQSTAMSGAAKDSATREGAMLALAAAQEASQTHWGKPEMLGELRHMQRTIEIIQDRWPNDSQISGLWLNLARLYQAFGDWDGAINAFDQIGGKDKAYADAQIASGIARWQQFLIQSEGSESSNLRANPLLNQASDRLRAGIQRIEKQSKQPTIELMFAKYNLAKIEALRSPEKEILKIIDSGKFPLAKSITSRKRHPANQVPVPVNLLKAVYQLKHDVLLQSGDARAAAEMLQEISKRTDESDRPDNQAQYFNAMVLEIKSLSEKEKITQEDLDFLEKQTERFRDAQVEISSNDQFWLANSVAKLSDQTANAQVAKRCFEQALQFISILRKDSSISKSLLRTIQLKEIDWLLGTDENEKAFDRLMEVLRVSPNVIDLQLKAHRILEQKAIDSDSVSTLKTVMNGDANSDLPLWGWAKLAASLQQLRYTRTSAQHDSNALLEAHFRLARCRWLLASVSQPTPSDSPWAKQLRKQKNAFGLLIQPDSPDEVRWQAAMNNLTLE